MKRLFASLVVVIGLLSMTVLSVAAQDTTVVISGDTSTGENQPGWIFNRDTSTSTPFEFNSDEASIGQGSLYVEPIGSNPADKFIGEFFINVPIANIESIAYDFLIGSSGTSSDANEFYMNVYANFGVSDDLKFYDCRYNIVPDAGQVGAFTTVMFDPNQSYPVATRGGAEASPYECPATPAGMDSLSPGSTVRVFSLNVGDTSANDVELDGFLDNVVVSLASGTTTYDFEPPTSGQMLGQLQSDTAELVEHRGAERALLASLARAERFLSDDNPNNDRLAMLGLTAYMMQVQLYEFFGVIPPDVADQLMAQASQIMGSPN